MGSRVIHPVLFAVYPAAFLHESIEEPSPKFVLADAIVVIQSDHGPGSMFYWNDLTMRKCWSVFPF